MSAGDRKIPSILDSAVTLSDDEKKELLKKREQEWFDNTLNTFIVMMLLDSAKKKVFIDSLPENFIRELQERKLPRKKKWKKVDYIHINNYYNIRKKAAESVGISKSSDCAFEELAELLSITVESATKLLTKARGELKSDKTNN